MQGKNVTLRRAQDTRAQEELREWCQSEEGLVDLVEVLVLALERSASTPKPPLSAASRSKEVLQRTVAPERLAGATWAAGGAMERLRCQNTTATPNITAAASSSPPPPGVTTTSDPNEGGAIVSVLRRTLELIVWYTSQGSLGGVSSLLCDALQPLLVRLMKVLVGALTAPSPPVREMLEWPSGSASTGASVDEERGHVWIEGLIDTLSAAMSSCAGGVVRREADAVLTLQFPPDPLAEDPTKQRDDALDTAAGNSPLSLSVVFGFADYADCETGAALWGGSVGLTLFLLERWNTWIQPQIGTTMRILELGCGTGVTSLVLVARLLQKLRCAAPRSTEVDYEFDVTDISTAALEALRHSFVERNAEAGLYAGAPVLRGSESREGTTTTTDDEPSSVAVRLFPLDFRAVPPALHGRYDWVVAGDIVYDLPTVPFLYPALEQLLRCPSSSPSSVESPAEEPLQHNATPVKTCSRRGGVAVLCCEAHRDGMAPFLAARMSQPGLEVLDYIPDLRAALTHFSPLEALCATKLSVLVLQRR